MPVTSKPAPGRAPKASRAQIVAAAVDLLDREGLEGLSMRRLAQDVGVTPMALYVYFRSKDELLDAVIDAGAAEIPLPAERGPWKTQMRKLLRETRTALERHPNALSVRFTRPMLGPGALRVPEAGVRILLAAGFTKADAASAWRALFSYTLGFALFSPDASRDEAMRHARSAFAALPEADYPALTAVAAEAIDAMAGDRQFDFGLDRLLDGLEARLRK